MLIEDFKNLIVTDPLNARLTLIDLIESDRHVAARLWLDLMDVISWDADDSHSEPVRDVVLSWQSVPELSAAVRILGTSGELRQMMKDDTKLLDDYRAGNQDVPDYIKKYSEDLDRRIAEDLIEEPIRQQTLAEFKDLIATDPGYAKEVFDAGSNNPDKKISRRWSCILFDLIDEAEGMNWKDWKDGDVREINQVVADFLRDYEIVDYEVVDPGYKEEEEEV